MQIKYLKLAKLEFHDVISYYETEQKGLGRKFESDIKSSINRIKKFPTAYAKIRNDIHKCVLHKFPYNI
ncbi:MAG: type II toxin-antitoxin system RelE/ParE family toxin, partial [Campylobacterota bacterium]|nr:type II toxin-antitoxin system RelE/ParE family toxin [Campylobacterota bacterium]